VYICSPRIRLLEIIMNRRSAPASALVSCVVLSLLSTPAAFAQTGAAATKQMQDTQRKAQQKAREAKSNAARNTNANDEHKARPASEAQ
jgi:hypothetical protein